MKKEEGPATAVLGSQPLKATTKRKRRVGLRGWHITLATGIVIIALWEVFGRINPLYTSYPVAIVQSFADGVMSGKLWGALLVTLHPFLIGLVLAIAVGVLVGIPIGRSWIAEAALGPYVIATYSMPLVALIPVFTLWFGLGISVKIAITFALAVFPVVINTWYGVKAVPRTIIEVGAAFGVSQARILLSIVFPSTLPYIMTGIRLAVGRAVIGIVVAEFFTAISGLGANILQAANNFDTAGMFVPIIILAVIGVGLTQIVEFVERRMAPWRIAPAR